MTEDASKSDTEEPESGDHGREMGLGGRDSLPRTERIARLTERFVHYVELFAGAVFAVLFAVGVVDLTIRIAESVSTGRITDPLVVIGFIDVGLLLLIIVEVYQTVIAYTREDDTRRIVRLVIYTGVIAMVRKVIIFRTGEYETATDALITAVAYTVIIAGLAALLLVERRYTPAARES